jgi:hypothetical protein
LSGRFSVMVRICSATSYLIVSYAMGFPLGCYLKTVIPGRAKREPGIHTPDRGYGFRACAKRRIPE